jgi:hypothetical protein
MDDFAVAAARFLPMALVFFQQQDSAEMPGQLFCDSQADHACTDDRDIEWMPFHGRHLKAKGKKVQGKMHKTGFRVKGRG